MIEARVLVLLYLASALSYGASSERGRVRLALLRGGYRARLAQGAALLLVALAIASWHQIEAGPAPWLVAALGLMTLASAIAVLAPLAPRLIWGAALACAVALPVLLALGGPA